MKYILSILFLFFLIAAEAQEDTSKYIKYPNSYGPQYRDIWATRVMRLPDTTGHRPMTGAPGAIGRNALGTAIFIWDGSSWQAISGGGGSTPSLQQVTTIGNITSLKIYAAGFDATNDDIIKRSDGRFLSYGSFYKNLTLGNTAFSNNTTGTGNISIGDSVLTLNTTGNYNTAIGRNAMYSNTTGSNNIAIGYNTSITGSDQINIGNSIYKLSTGQIKLGSYGSGTFTGTPTKTLSVDASGNVIETANASGGTVTNVTATYPMTITSTSTVTPNVLADTGRFTTQIATGGDIRTVKDSLGAIIGTKGTGTVTSVATNTGSGITGGTITTTGTIAADTTVLSTKAHVTDVLQGYVPITRTVNGKALSSNITLGLASADFANQGTTTTVLHGNASGNPSFGAVSLTADISGILGSTSGGSGINNAGTLTWGAGGTLGTAAYTAASAYEVPLTFSSGLTRSTNTITNNLITGLAGGQTAIGGTASAENLILSSTSNGTKGYIGITNAPRATANYGSLSIGSGAFDGSTTGFFTGNSNGTQLAVNAASGYTGDLFNLQKAGVAEWKVGNDGTVTASKYTTNGGLLYTDGSGVVNQTGAGTSSQILHGGTTPTYKDTAVVGYALQGQTAQLATPADAETDYIGNQNVATSASSPRVYIPQGGTITKAYVYMFNGTTGTNEASTIQIDLNNTSQTTISSAVDNSASNNAVSNTGLSITVAAGDYIRLKWVTPTWATNPLAVRISWTVWVKE